MDMIWIVPVVGIATILFAAGLAWNVLKRDSGTPEMQRIAGMIFEGAMAFLRRQYQTIAMLSVVTAVVVGLIVGYFDESVKTGVLTGVAFLVGAACSALAGFIGMYVAVKSNVRCASRRRVACARRSPCRCGAAPSPASWSSPSACWA